MKNIEILKALPYIGRNEQFLNILVFTIHNKIATKKDVLGTRRHLKHPIFC